MLYTFRILSSENKDFARELVIDSKLSFLDFHNCLQENLGYDPKQLASFFLTNSSWEKELQITLIDMMNEVSDICITMEEAKLSNHIKEKAQRMLYVFDFFSERSFFIELTEIMDKSDKKASGAIVFSHGDAPNQIELDLTTNTSSEGELNDEFGIGSFDDELSEGINFIDTDEFPEE